MVKLFLSICFRNLFRHRGKSIIVGSLIFIVALVMTLGNAIIKGMNLGLERNIVHGFTGNLIIISTNQQEKEVFDSMTGRPMAALQDYPKIEAVISNQPFIEDYLPIGRNVAMVLSETQLPLFWMIFSVDLDEYTSFFKNEIITIEGEPLDKEKRGLFIGNLLRNQTAETSDMWLYSSKSGIVSSNIPPKILSNQETIAFRSDVSLVGLGEETGIDIRLPVVGVFRFAQLNALFGGSMVFVDPLSYQEMFHYAQPKAETLLPAQKKKILESDNLDALFEQNLFADTIPTSSETYSETTIKKALKKSNTTISSERIYNAILIKTRKSENDAKTLATLNHILKQANVDGKAISWKEATPQLAQFIGVIQGLFGVIIFFLFLVSLIMVMNTLSMSVVERISELGMMRAIGTQKSFIGRMIYTETLILGVVFGGSGIITGALISWILSALHIKAPNEMVQLIFGGDFFQPTVFASDILSNLLLLLIVLSFAALYPIRLAKKITPLEAISQE